MTSAQAIAVEPTRSRVSRLGGLITTSPLLTVTVVLAAVGLVMQFTGNPGAASLLIFAYGLIVVAVELAGMLANIRSGDWGLDVLAVAAVLSTIAVGDYWAAMVVILMITGGQALETYASARAARELTALLERVPQFAHVRTPNGSFADVAVAEVRVGDILIVKPGETVPVDAVLRSGEATFDESSLTGESLPVTRRAGDAVLSGSVNGGDAIEAAASAIAADSQFQKILELVAAASNQKAPFVRMANRYAVPFTAAAFTLAGVAWLVSGDSHRFAEVLVVATPCPLLIAAPVAFIAGMSLAARSGAIVKSGGVLEILSRIRTAVFDKTGTLTHGEPAVDRVEPENGFSAGQVLRAAAAAESFSVHTLAHAIGAGAPLTAASVTDVSESVGRGVVATVDGVLVVVGKAGFVAEHTPVVTPAVTSAVTPAVTSAVTPAVTPGELSAGEMSVWVGIGGKRAGRIVLRDALRTDAGSTIDSLRRLGIERFAILSGDARTTAEQVGRTVGIEDVRSGLLPGDKVSAVRDLPERPVMMVGDGINDAPVLAVADVGVAMGARGSTAASESADVVIMLDDLQRVVQVVRTARRSVRIARQSIILGIALSSALMVVAAFGVIPAIIGAGLQEFVDLASILNSLRAARARPQTK
ncbi:MAG TPA: heavy metal translocating P-type ATPase [Leifsonia sp.]|nr:heavy metal translocating P-type ATPase [Leifsonia sp.]